MAIDDHAEPVDLEIDPAQVIPEAGDVPKRRHFRGRYHIELVCFLQGGQVHIREARRAVQQYELVTLSEEFQRALDGLSAGMAGGLNALRRRQDVQPAGMMNHEPF